MFHTLLSADYLEVSNLFFSGDFGWPKKKDIKRIPNRESKHSKISEERYFVLIYQYHIWLCVSVEGRLFTWKRGELHKTRDRQQEAKVRYLLAEKKHSFEHRFQRQFCFVVCFLWGGGPSHLSTVFFLQHPWKIKMEPKKVTQLIGKSSSKPPFVGSMLMFFRDVVGLLFVQHVFCCVYVPAAFLGSCWLKKLTREFVGEAKMQPAANPHRGDKHIIYHKDQIYPPKK